MRWSRKKMQIIFVVWGFDVSVFPLISPSFWITFTSPCNFSEGGGRETIINCVLRTFETNVICGKRFHTVSFAPPFSVTVRKVREQVSKTPVKGEKENLNERMGRWRGKWWNERDVSVLSCIVFLCELQLQSDKQFWEGNHRRNKFRSTVAYLPYHRVGRLPSILLVLSLHPLLLRPWISRRVRIVLRNSAILYLANDKNLEY